MINAPLVNKLSTSEKSEKTCHDGFKETISYSLKRFGPIKSGAFIPIQQKSARTHRSSLTFGVEHTASQIVKRFEPFKPRQISPRLINLRQAVNQEKKIYRANFKRASFPNELDPSNPELLCPRSKVVLLHREHTVFQIRSSYFQEIKRYLYTENKFDFRC